MKNPWVIVGVIAVVLIGGSVWYSSEVSKRNNEGVTVFPHIKGNPDAAVTLVEYSDFECPACASFQPVLTDILATHGDALRFEYKHFPLVQIHTKAEAAARAAEAAGQQGKFFEYHDVLFARQTEWAKSTNPYSHFVRYAEELGLDVALFKRHSKSSILADRVRAEFADAREKGLTGTPSFYLNGQRMTLETYEDFKKQIEAAVSPTVDFTVPVSGMVEGQ